MIEVRELSFAYGQSPVLSGLSFTIGEGGLTALLGCNGAGKTTLFRCMLGLNPSFKGAIEINGKNLRNLSMRQRAREISYIPQSHAPVYDYEVLDVVLMSTTNDMPALKNPGPDQLKRAYEALERVGIAHLAQRTYTQISGGEQQMVLIARALAQNARTIIMDEPTSALDYGNTVKVLTCVRRLAREGMSIIQSTHQPDQAFLYSDKTLVLCEGTVCTFGPPKEVITKELISKLYDVDVEVNSLYDDKVRVCVPVSEIAN